MAKLSSRRKMTHSAESIYLDYVAKLLRANKNYRSASFNGRSSFKIYEIVIDEEGKKQKKPVIDYKLFKSVLSEYNKAARVKLLQGKTLDLLNNLGKLYFKLIERNPKNPVIDWGESKKLKQLLIDKGKFVEGKTKWLVYFADDNYVKLGWQKGAITNKSVFDFEMAGSNTTVGTFVYMTIKTLKEKPYLKSLYRFYPLKNIANKT